MGRIKLTVAYEGTRFAGWQFQPGQRTVQGVIERAISNTVRSPVRVHGSGRTDSGVHAIGQVAHFDVPAGFDHVPWQKALNPQLPRDVRVLTAEPVADDFHARYSGGMKTYSYVLWMGKEWLLPQRRHFVWACPKLDVPAMEAGAQHLLGEHDFSAFQNTGTAVATTVRTVTDIRCRQGSRPEELVWLFTATGFLKQMVRNMMGCLVFVGRGKLEPGDVGTIRDGADRTKAPPTAPPQGLTLERVEYPD